VILPIHAASHLPADASIDHDRLHIGVRVEIASALRSDHVALEYETQTVIRAPHDGRRERDRHADRHPSDSTGPGGVVNGCKPSSMWIAGESTAPGCRGTP
jgi:hypothetical protein